MADDSPSPDDTSSPDPEKLPEVVAKIVDPAIDRLPEQYRPEIRTVVRRVFQQTIKFHRGPLPDPETLADYGRIIPGSPERLLKLLEDQTAHRQRQESRLVRLHIQRTHTGQWIAAALAAMFGVASYNLGMANHDWLAGVMATSTIGAILTVFVLGRSKGDSEDTSDD